MVLAYVLDTVNVLNPGSDRTYHASCNLVDVEYLETVIEFQLRTTSTISLTDKSDEKNISGLFASTGLEKVKPSL